MQNQQKPYKKAGPYSGFIIIRLAGSFSYRDGETLEEFADANQLTRLSELLKQHRPSSTRRTVKSVSLEKLKALEERAKKSPFPPLNSLADYWRLDFRDSATNHDEVVNAFQSLPGVELAYKELPVADPVVDPDSLTTQQGYLNPAPQGINALWAWGQGGSGAGVGFVDLEQGWIPAHQDLAGAGAAAGGPALVSGDNRDGHTFLNEDGDEVIYRGDHGTAVLGEVVGMDNTLGIVGIAPSVSYVRMVSHYDAASGTALHVADAIVAAIDNMDNVGDVLLLEVARGEFEWPTFPTETDNADFDAIRLAAGNGIIVIEAGGNGDSSGTPMDLDAWTDSSMRFRLNRGHADFRDSGAILVGAAHSASTHNKMEWSNFGTRFDCYGWGENIATSGYSTRGSHASLGGGGTPSVFTDDYTSNFSGTSAASPIIAGAALILQGLYKTAAGTSLSPMQMRALLSNPATGIAQGPVDNDKKIGVMPNLRDIIEDTLELTPDLYLRDNVGDNGHVPSAGGISTSPDIIVRPAAVADPTAAFGEASGTENSSSEGHLVEFGQNNFVYVRMKNRGGSDANGATATVYWSEVSTLVTPDLWHPIGTSSPVNVPVGDTLVVTPAITWNTADIPAEGHYCFVGILNHPQDGAPPIPGPANFDMNDFTALIRNYNNVTWRNFNVINAVLPPPGPSGADAGGAGKAEGAGAQEKLEFNITGAPDRERSFDIEFIRALPKGAQVWLELPADLFASIELPAAELKETKPGKR